MTHIWLKPLLEPLFRREDQWWFAGFDSFGVFFSVTWGMFSAKQWLPPRPQLFAHRPLNGSCCFSEPLWFKSNIGNTVVLLCVIAVMNYNADRPKECSPDVPNYLFSFLPQMFHYSSTRKGVTNTWSTRDFWNPVLSETPSTGNFIRLFRPLHCRTWNVYLPSGSWSMSFLLP